MKFYDIPLMRGEYHYSLSSLFGHLLRSVGPPKPDPSIQLPRKLLDIFVHCENPYLLKKQSPAWPKILTPSHLHTIGCKRLRNILRLSRWNFFLSYLYASNLTPRFSNATEAITFFRAQTTGMDQDNLCLPRSLFAAATSEIFNECGAILIGVFLPSRSMHAWVIEAGQQPDPTDSMWVNFCPVAALC